MKCLTLARRLFRITKSDNRLMGRFADGVKAVVRVRHFIKRPQYL